MGSDGVGEGESRGRLPVAPPLVPRKVHQPCLHRAGGEESGRSHILGKFLAVETHLRKNQAQQHKEIRMKMPSNVWDMIMLYVLRFTYLFKFDVPYEYAAFAGHDGNSLLS